MKTQFHPLHTKPGLMLHLTKEHAASRGKLERMPYPHVVDLHEKLHVMNHVRHTHDAPVRLREPFSKFDMAIVIFVAIFLLYLIAQIIRWAY